MKGNSVLPTSSFQMICRTRNMHSLTWYASPPPEEHRHIKYKSIEHAYEMATQHKETTNIYMYSSYVDADDNIQFAPNSFYNMYIFNEYVKDIYDDNKIEHLRQILIDNGFDCSGDMQGEPTPLREHVVDVMKGLTDDAIEETFKRWVLDEIDVEMFDTRSAMLGLTNKRDKDEYKDFIIDKTTFEDHMKLKLLLKEKRFIESKASAAIENSYAEFGINNIYSKIKLLIEFEKQTNINRFDYSKVLYESIEDETLSIEDKTWSIEDKTWSMIQKVFGKKNKNRA